MSGLPRAPTSVGPLFRSFDILISPSRRRFITDEFGISLQLFPGGVFPVPTRKGLLVAYLALAGLIVTVCLFIYGVPTLSDWKSTWLPALLGPAILVGPYCLAAILGRRRLDRQIEGD